MKRLCGEGGVDPTESTVVGVIELAQANGRDSHNYNTRHHETHAEDEKEVMIAVVDNVGSHKYEDNEASEEHQSASAHDKVPCSVLLVAVSLVHG